MKFTRIILTWLCLLAVIAAVIWGSFELKERFGHEPDEEAAAKVEDKKPLDAEALEHAGVELTPLAAAKWQAQLSGFGRVMDPAPLVTLQNERLMAEAALKASEAEVARARKLFEGGENIARKVLEQAEAAVTADRLKFQAAEQRFLLEWGPEIDKDRDDLIAQILSGKTVLVRAELSSASVPDEAPEKARVLVAGHNEPLEAEVIAAAPAVDAKSQAAAWFLKMARPKHPLPPGLSVNVEFTGDEKPEDGVLIPAKAVLHYLGEAWVFTEGEEKGHFERKQVELEHALAGGWFASEDFKPGEKIVTTGADSLLADELKAQIEGD